MEPVWLDTNVICVLGMLSKYKQRVGGTTLAFRVSRNNYRELTESRFTLAISTSEHARGNHLTLS